MTREEIIARIRDLFWEEIEEAVSLDRLSPGGTDYARPRFAVIARDFARWYRTMRARDKSLPQLLVEDFREYLSDTYDDATLR